MPAVIQSSEDSRLLRDLRKLLPVITARLNDRDAWFGYTLEDRAASHGYDRLQCTDRLVATASRAEYLVGIHRFNATGRRTAMHDHRYPFAVFPFVPGGSSGTVLYEMPWESRVADRVCDSGRILVRAGVPYAIEDHRNVFHAVRTLKPHFSVVIAEVSNAPSRENRLTITQLDAPTSERLRFDAWTALQTGSCDGVFRSVCA